LRKESVENAENAKDTDEMISLTFKGIVEFLHFIFCLYEHAFSLVAQSLF